MENLYKMIFKRKSFHHFREPGEEKLTKKDLKEIEDYFYSITPLVSDIKVKIKFVKLNEGEDRNQEYNIVFYSEKKDNYLQNMGYIGEKLDLYLASKNIGALWYGLGETDEKVYEGLDYVIMMAIAKIDSESKFREDFSRCERKELSEIWKGDNLLEVGKIARFSPSACNTQPWIVESSDNELKVYRYSEEGKNGILTRDKIVYCNQIDIGIFLSILEECLNENKISYERNVLKEEDINKEKNLTAIYSIK